MGKTMHYTAEMLRFLSKNRDVPRSELTTMFNNKFKTRVSVDAIKGTCRRNGWLTGTRGMGLYKPNRGSFVKGHRPPNWRPVGSERVAVDGYIEIKTAEPNKWRMKHVVVWEAQHGQIERECLVRFRDNNPLNCNLENLEKVHRRVHLRLNQCNYATLPPELKPAAKTVAEIEIKIFEAKRKGRTAVRPCT